MVTAGVVTWAYIIISITTSTGWFAGTVAAILSLAVFYHWRRYVEAPFRFWLEAWRFADSMVVHKRQ